MDTPNPAEFSVNEKEGEFEVIFSVTGTIRTTIKAIDLADAKRQAAAMIEDESFGTDLDDADDVRVDHVYKSPRMFRVMREGRTMQVSRLAPGDVPRQPTDYGF